MNDTIREALRRRSRRALTTRAIGLLLCIVSLWALGGGYEYVVVAGAIIGLVTAYGGLLHLDRARCPRCQARLGLRVNQYRLARRNLMNFCPHCGVSFEQPISR
jgi:ribosomal protein S27AE